MADLIVAADCHLRAADPDLEAFLRFLRHAAASGARVFLLGDIFDLWIAREGLELPFHRAVVEEVSDLRRAGARISYVQGNRDYFVAQRYPVGPFDAVVEESMLVEHGGRRIHLAHGDLVNRDDRQYQWWRRASRSRPVAAAFSALPPRSAARLSAALERKFRTTNAAYRRGFPAAHAEAYARRAFAAGADTVVLGHFHQARREEYAGLAGAPGGVLHVLPGWREDRRYLRFGGDGAAELIEFI